MSWEDRNPVLFTSIYASVTELLILFSSLALIRLTLKYLVWWLLFWVTTFSLLVGFGHQWKRKQCICKLICCLWRNCVERREPGQFHFTRSCNCFDVILWIYDTGYLWKQFYNKNAKFPEIHSFHFSVYSNLARAIIGDRYWDGVWLGLNDSSAETIWVWLDGTRAYCDVVRWGKEEPNGHRLENCGELWGEFRSYFINDNVCSEHREGLCERKIVP